MLWVKFGAKHKICCISEVILPLKKAQVLRHHSPWDNVIFPYHHLKNQLLHLNKKKFCCLGHKTDSLVITTPAL